MTPYKPAIRTALTAANIATYELKPREEDPGASEAGVRMGTMKRIKGLEFRAVAVACSSPTDPMNHIWIRRFRTVASVTSPRRAPGNIF